MRSFLFLVAIALAIYFFSASSKKEQQPKEETQTKEKENTDEAPAAQFAFNKTSRQLASGIDSRLIRAQVKQKMAQRQTRARQIAAEKANQQKKLPKESVKGGRTKEVASAPSSTTRRVGFSMDANESAIYPVSLSELAEEEKKFGFLSN